MRAYTHAEVQAPQTRPSCAAAQMRAVDGDPDRSVARKRAATAVVAGKASPRRGRRRLSRIILMISRNHYGQRRDCTHTRRPRKMHLYRAGNVHQREPERFSNDVIYETDTTDARRIHAAIGRSQHVTARPTGPGHLHLAEAPHRWSVSSVLWIPPNGSEGVVEPGARAVGANGIERCPPHVYP